MHSNQWFIMNTTWQSLWKFSIQSIFPLLKKHQKILTFLPHIVHYVRVFEFSLRGFISHSVTLSPFAHSSQWSHFHCIRPTFYPHPSPTLSLSRNVSFPSCGISNAVYGSVIFYSSWQLFPKQIVLLNKESNGFFLAHVIIKVGYLFFVNNNLEGIFYTPT